MIGIAQVAADDGPGRAGALNRARFDGDSGYGQLGDDISDAVIDDQKNGALRRSVQRDVDAPRPCVLDGVVQRLLADAIKGTRPSTNEWLETAKSYATYANRTGLYDDLVAFLEKG